MSDFENERGILATQQLITPMPEVKKKIDVSSFHYGILTPLTLFVTACGADLSVTFTGNLYGLGLQK